MVTGRSGDRIPSRSVHTPPEKKKPGVSLAETPGRRVKVADERGEPYKQFRQPPKLSLPPLPNLSDSFRLGE